MNSGNSSSHHTAKKWSEFSEKSDFLFRQLKKVDKFPQPLSKNQFFPAGK
jgi:hypothetical protein